MRGTSLTDFSFKTWQKSNDIRGNLLKKMCIGYVVPPGNLENHPRSFLPRIATGWHSAASTRLVLRLDRKLSRDQIRLAVTWTMKYRLVHRDPDNGLTTVDGWNPAPVDRQFIPLFTRFYTSRVVQDFFHQQYHPWVVPIPLSTPNCQTFRAFAQMSRFSVPQHFSSGWM